MLDVIGNFWNVITDLHCSQFEVIPGPQKFNAAVQEKMMHPCDQYIHEALD